MITPSSTALLTILFKSLMAVAPKDATKEDTLLVFDKLGREFLKNYDELMRMMALATIQEAENDRAMTPDDQSPLN